MKRVVCVFALGGINSTKNVINGFYKQSQEIKFSMNVKVYSPPSITNMAKEQDFNQDTIICPCLAEYSARSWTNFRLSVVAYTRKIEGELVVMKPYSGFEIL